MQGNIKENW